MESKPTMLHLRSKPYTMLVHGERVPMLRLIERVGGGWGKSRTDALCMWPDAESFTASLGTGDTLLVELHDLHAHEGHMRGSILRKPELLPRSTQSSSTNTTTEAATA